MNSDIGCPTTGCFGRTGRQPRRFGGEVRPNKPMQLTITLPRLRLGRALAADGPAVGWTEISSDWP